MLLQNISLIFIACTFGWCQCINKLEWSCNVLKGIEMRRIKPDAFKQNKFLNEDYILNYISRVYFANETKYMDFNGRGIVGILPYTFSKFSSLRVLDLSKNFIEQLEANTFDGLNNLLALYLNRNKLTTIDPHVFSQLSSISILEISSNLISKLYQNTFTNLTELVEVDLNDNKIAEIELDTFLSLKELSRLNLAKNSLKNIDFMPQNMTNLYKLDLSNNYLTTLPYNSFVGLTGLKEIFICNHQSGPISISTFNIYKLIQKHRTVHFKSNLSQLKENVNKLVQTFGEVTSIDLLKASKNQGIDTIFYPLNRTSCRINGSVWFNELYKINGLCRVTERIYEVKSFPKRNSTNEFLSICQDIWSSHKTVRKSYKLESYRLTSSNFLYLSRTTVTGFKFKILVHGMQTLILIVLTIAAFFKIATIKKQKMKRLLHEIQQARRRYG